MGHGDLRFVVHEHHSRILHFDLRLELGGTLRSWAIPKGPSMDPEKKRLAIQVSDHDLDYIDFEGEIPEGEYGAGMVVIWDTGTYKLLEQHPDRLVVEFFGQRLRGRFILFRLKGKDQNWILKKARDQFAVPGWELELALDAKVT